MNRQQHLLIRLMEECNEVAQRASKALVFSLEEIQPDQPLTNAERIIYEFNDLYAVMEMLREDGAFGSKATTFIRRDMISLKKEKVEKFLLHSKANGTLTE